MQETLKTAALMGAAVLAIGLAFFVAAGLLLMLAVVVPVVILLTAMAALLSGDLGRHRDPPP